MSSSMSRKHPLGVALLVLMLAASLSLGAWVGLEPVIDRFAALKGEFGVEGIGRWAIWKDTVALIREYPVLGVGLGVFDIAITGVQMSYLNRFINYAHNDFLQLVAELGSVGAPLLLVPIFWVLILSIRRVCRPEDGFGRAMALGAASSILAMLCHSVTDGNLSQIPANALVFSLLLALGYSAARREAS